MAARYEDPGWCEQHRLRLDYSYVMEDTIGTPAGVSRRELADAATRMAAIDARVRAEHRAGVLGFMDLPTAMTADVPRLVETADRLAAAGDAHVVLGIGGSYLGARALFEALGHPYHNELPRCGAPGSSASLLRRQRDGHRCAAGTARPPAGPAKR